MQPCCLSGGGHRRRIAEERHDRRLHVAVPLGRLEPLGRRDCVDAIADGAAARRGVGRGQDRPATTGHPGQLTQGNDRRREVVEDERSHRDGDGTGPHRQRRGVGDGRWRPAVLLPREHRRGSVERQRMTAAGGDRVAGHAGPGTEVEHRLPSERDRAPVDEELGEGSVDEARATHPPLGRVRVPVGDGSHVRSSRRSAPRCAAASHQRSSASSPSAFSQPNVAIMPSRHRSSCRSNQPLVSMP